MTKEDLKSRGNNRSQQPTSSGFREFIGSDWGTRTSTVERYEVADYLAARHELVSQRFPGERLVIPAGGYKTRNNDCDYRFRAHSAFAHMTGLGAELEPDAVLVLNPVDGGHEATLYFHPCAPRSSEEFYADSRYGEFWVGARPTLEEMSKMTGLRCDSIDNLPDALAKDLGQVTLRVVPQSDARIESEVHELRVRAEIAANAGLLPDEVELYGKWKGKIDLSVLDRLASRPDAKLVDVTAITPTKAGEGKTTTAVSLTQGLGVIALGEALSIGTRQQAVVAIDGRGQVEQGLQQPLDVRGLEEVLAAYDVGDALQRVVDHDGQVIGDADVLAGQHHVAARQGRVDLDQAMLAARALTLLGEGQRPARQGLLGGVQRQAPGEGGAGRQALGFLGGR